MISKLLLKNMGKKLLLSGLMISVMSFALVTPLTAQAKERETIISITKEGQYVVKDYKQLYDEDFDTCEILFTPEKTGVYSLTSSINDKCKKVTMEVFDDNYSFDEVVVDGKDKDKVDINKKVYLEKGISYYVWVYIEDNDALETFDFNVKCIDESEVNPKIDANFNISEDEAIPFEKVNVKGFDWNKETNTLTLNNCDLKGSIEIKADKGDYDYDTMKYTPTFTIDIKGKSSIENSDENMYLIENSYGDKCDVVIKGEGKNKSTLIMKNFMSNIYLDNDDNLTIKDLYFKANRLWMSSEKIYINNSKMKFVCDWSLIPEDEDIPEETVTPLYADYDCTFCNLGTYINNSNISVEMELIPKKYLKRLTKDGSTLFISLKKLKKSKVTIKGSKEYIKGLKNGKYKFFDYPTKKEKQYVKKFKYVGIKSYRNAEKKGSIIKGEINYSKKSKIDVLNDDIEYKIIKQASTDGKLAGKVYVERLNNKNKKSVIVKEEVCIDGARYKVVGISKKAFAKGKKLKCITIKSKLIKRIGRGAFNNGNKITLKIPKIKKKKYKNLIKKSKEC